MEANIQRAAYKLGYAKVGYLINQGKEVSNNYPRGSMEWNGFQDALNDKSTGKYDNKIKELASE